MTAQTSSPSKLQRIFWLALSLMFAVIYSSLALQQAFSADYVVQDDARQHVFWMQRFLDSQLFPNDRIADYFQSVVPVGYRTLYQLMAAVGIEPLVLSKVLPFVLSLITTGYCFGVTLQILPVPVAGFISSLLLNQTLWMRDDLVSATPRAFVYPLLLVFWYYLLRRSLLPSLGAIALQGLFYPQSVFISSGLLIIQLGKWERGWFRFSKERREYYFSAAGLAVALLVMLPYALTTSEFEPIVTATQARGMREFWAGGRASFFNDNFWEFWLNGDRSGILPRRQSLPILLYGAFLLPLLLQFSIRFPLSRQVKGGVMLLPQIILVSLSLFFAANALLFKLHLPSRYTEHTLRLVLPLATGMALTILLDGIFHWGEHAKRIPKLSSNFNRDVQPFPSRYDTFPPLIRGVRGVKMYFIELQTPVLPVGLAALVGIILIFYPSFVKEFPKTAYEVGQVPELYEFFASQPKDSLIASLSREADNLPTFSHRSILVSWEYAIPYHLGYYKPFRQRAIALIRAQYSPELGEIRAFIENYGIDFWLLERSAFTSEYVANSKWIQQFQPIATEAEVRLNQGTTLALPGLMEECSVFEAKGLVVLEAKCIVAGELGVGSKISGVHYKSRWVKDLASFPA
ncbi:hypothetical protein IQ257_13700 [Coleofasciculus sp. LEGE 07092]|uniref:hypothetical protein n=1 Tax=Coleofasciculus sp. LEGE 07081 TaxID=2777967 RepID=UPI00187E3AD8|nr:hypothetical protein [Coleofasciculus sp. LEGE 07081]MBE9149530.1 hypothetical protein [Coleofasciculus sp. LEGE 07092]